MRELTEYEKKKWFDKYHRFEMDSSEGHQYFLSYGDELGEAFDGALYCTDKESYGLENWFVHAAQVQTLDMYYLQIMYYSDSYGGYDTVETLGLPSLELLRKEFPDVFDEQGFPSGNYPNTSKWREAWDWAMDWREEHAEEIAREREKKALQARLESLES